MFFAQIGGLHFCKKTIEDRDRRNLLRGLAVAVRAPVVICGGITESGRKRDYDLASTFLYRKVQFEGDLPPVGLDLREDDVAAVPGGRDRRNLKWSLFDTLLRRRTYPRPIGRLPRVHCLQISTGLALHLLLLDSARRGGANRADWNRLGAEAERLRRGSQAARILRVLVLPQSPEADFDSPSDLKAFVENYHVAALLTGHADDSLCRQYSWTKDGSEQTLHEMRTAAALTYEVGFLLLEYSDERPAGFLEHTLLETDDPSALRWIVAVRYWDQGSRFQQQEFEMLCDFYPVLINRETGRPLIRERVSGS